MRMQCLIPQKAELLLKVTSGLQISSMRTFRVKTFARSTNSEMKNQLYVDVFVDEHHHNAQLFALHLSSTSQTERFENE